MPKPPATTDPTGGEPIATTGPAPTAKADAIALSFSPAAVEEHELGAVREVLDQSPGGEREAMQAVAQAVTVEQLVLVLKASYAVGGLYYGYRDIWTPRDDEMRQVAIALLPQVQAVIARFPAAAAAVEAIDTTSPWVQLIWFWARPVWYSEMRRREERRAQEEESSHAGQPAPSRTAAVSVGGQTGSVLPGESRFIVP